MQITASDATGLTVLTGRETSRNPLLPNFPIIILNFHYDLAQQLVQMVLQPHARPEHVFAGYYRHDDGNMTLGCYVLVPMSPTGNKIIHVIGNEINFKPEAWTAFNERLGEFGKFGVSCGIYTPDPNGTCLTDPIWILECTTFHLEDITPLTHEILISL